MSARSLSSDTGTASSPARQAGRPIVPPRKGPAKQDVVIVGGGITGLSLARLLKKGANVTLLEAQPTFGGNLRGERISTPYGQFVVDHGPDSWVMMKPDATALCKELGLGADLIETTLENRAVYIVHNGKLRPMPDGLALGVPTNIQALIETDLFSWPAKVRMAMEPLIPKGEWTSDPSVGEFLTYRLGREPTETLIAPLLGGIFAGDAFQISLKTSFPQFLADEKDSSLVLAAMKRRKMLKGRKASAFHSLRGGVRQLVDALVASLEGVALHPDAVATTLKQDYRTKRWTLGTTDGRTFEADRIVFAGPTWAAKPMLDQVDKSLPWANFSYGSAATAFFAFPKEAVTHSLQGTGFIIPAREGRKILAGTWVSSKWVGRAPEGTVLLRAFLGGKSNGEAVDASDDMLAETALAELRDLLGITGEPIFSRVYRYKDASPNPRPGHIERVQTLRSALSKHKTLHVVGNGYDGSGMPDCIRQAKSLAAEILGG